MAAFLVVVSDHQDAVHDRHAKQRDKTDGGGDAEVETGDVERQDAASDREGDARKRQKAVTKLN